jgi:hypothetical protein
MKIILLILITGLCFADGYYVEIDKITKENMSDYILKTGEKLDTIVDSRIRIKFDTKEQYDRYCGGSNWKDKWDNYKNVTANLVIINSAISTQLSKELEDKAVQDKLVEIAKSEIEKEKLLSTPIEEPIQ